MESAGTARGGLGGRVAAALFASVLVFLVAHAAPLGLGGGRFLLLARAIVEEGSLVLEVRGGDPRPRIDKNDDLVVGGRFVLNTHPGYSFLLVPGEALAGAVLTLRPRGSPEAAGEDRLEILLALALVPLPLAALAVVALADLVARTTGKRSAGLLAAGLFLLGTPFGVLSCCVNQNAPEAALLVLSLCALRFPRGNVFARAAAAGALAGMAFLVDVSAVILAGLIFAHAWRGFGRGAAVALALGFAALAGLLAPYDLAVFGELTPPNRMFVEAWKNTPFTGVQFAGTPLSPLGVFYPLASWRGGVLLFSPFVVPALVSGVRSLVKERGEDRELVLLCVVAVPTALAYATVVASLGNFQSLPNAVFGPRYQVWALPLAAVLLSRGERSWIAWALAAFSVAVCSSGLMYPPPVPSGCNWFFYMSARLVLVLGPRSPIASPYPTGGRWYGYDESSSRRPLLEVVFLLLVLVWVRWARSEASREAGDARAREAAVG